MPVGPPTHTTPPDTLSPRHLKRQDGQAVVEFVVILPVLLLVLMAIYQFGQVFVNYMDVTSAAREGARKAAVSRTAGTCSSRRLPGHQPRPRAPRPI